MHSLSQDDDSQIKILDGAQKNYAIWDLLVQVQVLVKNQNQIISLK